MTAEQKDAGTPRTDAKERETAGLRGATHAHYGWKFARTLERELTAARTAIGLLLADARRVDRLDPPERMIPTQLRVQDILQARAVIASGNDEEEQ